MKIHSNWKKWYYYLSPKWLNCITWKKGDPKIYRWLFFVWTK